jgi:hypothetical protein
MVYGLEISNLSVSRKMHLIILRKLDSVFTKSVKSGKKKKKNGTVKSCFHCY